MTAMGLSSSVPLEIHNARLSQHNRRYTDFLYARQQRHGMLYRDCQCFGRDHNVRVQNGQIFSRCGSRTAIYSRVAAMAICRPRPIW